MRAELSENGEYPVYQNSLKPLGFYTSMNCNKYTAFIIAAGAAGEIGFSDVDFWAADDCYYFECPKDRLDSKFLYYFLLKENNKLLAQVRRASIPRLGKIAIENLKIPIPPLSVQQEIVKILDTLTALTSELNLRQKQYQYYRDMLLNFKELNGGGYEIEWKTLGEVCHLQRGRVISKQYLDENSGEYPVYSSQTVNNGEIGKINTFDFEGEYLSWTTDGANAGTVFYRTGKFSITNVCGLVTIKDDLKLNYKFLFYWLSIEAKKYVYSGMGNPKMMSNQMEKVLIPIPPLAEQDRIAKILDKFDTLTNSISEGLPKEIELRNKQYEYYREMLLGFERV